MNVRPEIQVQLDALEEKLVHWVARVRHPAQFWPQFEVLAGEILDQCERSEREQVRAYIQSMLNRLAPELPPWR
ncbi:MULTISPECIES: hypothetical protein [Stenotrophomonas]|uniref:hypothetical protein n=1 Tax=Stenotrophomonas TaxID=40323 RepID=UPI0008721B64|nr:MULTISPECIES: hypothetical protein [Stenotrophomonas]OEZ02595.1 hypothetical protein BIY45_00345 [Stenotrophomonas sp. BIIR7]